MLLNIKDNEIGQVVSARELYNFLIPKSRFNDWIHRRIDKYEFIANTDFIAYTQKRVHATGRDYEEIDYLITMDMAKELSMIENNELARVFKTLFYFCKNIC